MRVDLRRYASLYVISVVTLVIVGIGLVQLAEIKPPSGAGTVVAVIVAALFEGQRAARIGGVEFSKSEAWSAAFAMTGVVAVTNAVMLGLLYTVPWIAVMLDRTPTQQIALVFMVLVLFALVANRYFLTTGFRAERKLARRQGGRATSLAARRQDRP